ncbi:rho GTPase-activating protein 45-like isoform X2 [Dendronephthya gigantea]|uniref:rho GTPase-activating protein 45-like isoform X2 n=1 Tax=Dendronephthya gigantea TaxID=151771 RepID=UPI00106A45CD|nr:rho GTPase-activating protein 45-like isoform X2 [Dendronephthya gigantea]
MFYLNDFIRILCYLSVLAFLYGCERIMPLETNKLGVMQYLGQKVKIVLPVEERLDMKVTSITVPSVSSGQSKQKIVSECDVALSVEDFSDLECSAGDDGDDDVDYPDDEEYGSEGDMLSNSMNMPSRQEPCNDILDDKDADLERVLLKMDSGVEFCLQWTKYWSKYVKDIANYVEKRAQLEAEYTKQLTKLAQATRASISEENYLPFQSTFITALDQDMEYSQKCQQTLAAISGSKFIQPLMQRRIVHDRARKDMKDDWTKTCRQVHESANSVKTTQHNYNKRQQELEKLNTRQADVKENKEDSFSYFSSNKGRKEEELRVKVEEAEQLYNNAIKIANDMLNEAEKTKVRIVAQTKQLVNECDRTFRSVTRKYFDMMHELAVPTPIHFKTLANSCQGYEPGKEFEDFVRFQQSTARSSVRPIYELLPCPNNPRSPAKAWPAGQMSDYEGGPSPSASPSSSPKNTKKPTRTRPHPAPSTDDESEGEMKRPRTSHSKGSKSSKPERRGKTPKFPKGKLTKEASTHTFHKIRAPARCSECDKYVFSGVECAQCGLSWHNKKCLENLQTACSHSRMLPSPMKRMKTFGVRFSEEGGVPVLVTKCVKEINRRGLKVKGIYRVSGVKSKMENLCQDFETNAESVDLSTQPPHLIASVLKLYIRQLPEPLMTTKLYADLIQLAKESTHLNWLTVEEYEGDAKDEFRSLLAKLQITLKKLPRSNYLTTATLIKHLHKVSLHEEYNQMNPQNLAIVFGPTILKLECENSTTSLSSLVDMSHQTRIVALLIVNPQVFDDVPDEPEEENGDVSIEENDSSLPNTPVEKFISLKTEEDESGMPNLYGERSTRVRGEGLSPMEKLASQSSEVKDNNKFDSDTIRTSDRIDIQGDVPNLFVETSILLPGSLEEQNKPFDFIQDGEHLVDDDNDRANHNVGHRINYGYRHLADENEKQNINTLPKDISLADEIQDEFNRKFQSADTANGVTEDAPSPGESSVEEDTSITRRRSKAFSVGKRNANPDMLAKRGSALINAYIMDNKKTEESDSSRDSPPGKIVSDVSVTTESLKQENDVGANNETVPSTSTVSSSANKTTDSDITPVNTESEEKGHRNGNDSSETSSSAVSKSGNESSIAALYRDTPSRKRSATYENEAKRMFENRPERGDKQLTSERLFAYGVRGRRARVSVKDQVKQLENREQNDASKAGASGVRSNKLPDTVTTQAGKTGLKGAANDTNGTSNDVGENKVLGGIDGKENVDGNSSNNTSSKIHEPLTRLYAAGGNSGIFQPPKSPVPKYRTADDKFCPLKRDISLESPRTPSSDSSADDSDDANVATETSLLPKWTGRGLTPRDSSQAPEFV